MGTESQSQPSSITLKRKHCTTSTTATTTTLQSDNQNEKRSKHTHIPSTTTTTTTTTQPTKSGDVYSRTKTTGSKGRGSLTGWTRCPICFPPPPPSPSPLHHNHTHTGGENQKNPFFRIIPTTKSTKTYALGRGISTHLKTVHTPWLPSKSELNRRERIRKRAKGLVYQSYRTNTLRGGGWPVPRESETESEFYDRVVRLELGDDVWDRDGVRRPVCWEPTEVEVEAWDNKVLELTEMVEKRAVVVVGGENRKKRVDEEGLSKGMVQGMDAVVQTQTITTQPGNNRNNSTTIDGYIPPGRNRNGTKTIQTYQHSLPPFLKAAANGDLQTLQKMVHTLPQNDTTNNAIQTLLSTKDRNGSTAEHWAAGGGHRSCLEFILECGFRYRPSSPSSHSRMGGGVVRKSKRKRDGKTSLHYAARNGHTHIIDYLLSKPNHTHNNNPNHTNSDDTTTYPTQSSSSQPDPIPAIVDIPSGDGTTPLHLACYGGHLHTIRQLIEHYHADTTATNEWECGMGHWLAMSIQSDPSELLRVLEYTKDFVCNGDKGGGGGGGGGTKTTMTTFHLFGRAQKQGHTAVHKAAQKRNKIVMRWLVKEAKEHWSEEERKVTGSVDSGGNRPSDIWSLMGSGDGDDDGFDEWIRTECNW